MGGKTKQSQRTKNNVRPSSSSRSAELLNNSMNLDGGLVTVSGGKGIPALFPTLTAVNIDQGLTPEFQMCVKKLNKKDPVTRVKALQELCDLVNNGNVDDVVTVLPTWARFYKTLTVDTDRKVREMTQVCQGALVRVCGRRTAPQLRALLPAWLQAQHDEHAPAMSHAQTSLKSTFPDNKLPEVISFCKTEVMAHFLDNLIGNAEAIINKKIESPDERALQLCRVVTSSLRGLELFVSLLPAAHHAWLWTELAPLLDTAAFWKFASHNMPQVRAAWCGVVGRVAERFGAQWAAAHGRRALRLLLGARDEHALVAAQRWACLLHFMHSVEDWQIYLDKKELLVKRVLDILETGGWGDAKHLSTMLLPVLAHLPQDILTKEFYEAFFTAIYNGLEKKNIISSKSERQCWITSLAECLRYLSIQPHDYVVEVATSVHRTWLKTILCTQRDVHTRNNLIKCSATNMTSLVKYWLKQSKEQNSEKYDQLLRNFWHNICSTASTQIDNCSTDSAEIETLMDAHILLLQTLKTTFVQETKKQLNIKFAKLEVESPAEEAPLAVPPGPPCDAALAERYERALGGAARALSCEYLRAAQRSQAPHALARLVTLLAEWGDARAFAAAAQALGARSPQALYAAVLRPWLAGDAMRCVALVDVVFLMMNHLNDEEQAAIFDSFEQLAPEVVEWCLARALAHPARGSAAARAWRRSARVAQAAAALARRALRRDTDAAHLLLACLAGGFHGEPLISEEGMALVISIITEAISAQSELTDAVTEADAEQFEWGGRFAARLVTALAAGPLHTETFATLVFKLFRLNLVVQRGDARLPADTWGEVLSSWQDGLAVLPEPSRCAFYGHAAKLLHALLFQRIQNFDIKKIEHIVSLAPYLFTRGGDSCLPEDITDIIIFTKEIFNLDTAELLAIETCALRHECVTSQLNCLYDDTEAIKNVMKSSSEQDVDELSELDVTTYVNKVLFRAAYLKTMLLHKAASDDDDETRCETLLTNNYIEMEFCKLLRDYVIVLSLHEGYEFWPHYNIIEEAKSKLDMFLSSVISATSASVRQKIVTSLSELAAASGYFWAYAHRYYVVSALSAEGAHKSYDTAQKGAELTGNGYFHMLQAMKKFGAEPECEYSTAYLVMLRSWHAAHCPELTLELVADLARCKEACDVDVVVNDYYRRQPSTTTMLYEMDVSEASWSAVVSNADVLEFLTLMVENRGWDAPAHHWDFTTISLCSLLTSVGKSKANWGSAKVAMLTLAALRLLAAVRRFATGAPRECERRTPLPHVAALGNEWRDVFAPDADGSVFSLATHVLNSCQASSITGAQAAVARALIATLPALQWRRAAGALPALAGQGAAALARASHPALKHLAYALLCTLAEPLVLDDAQRLAQWSDESSAGEAAELADAAGAGEPEEEKERPPLALDYLHGAFSQLQELVDAALLNVQLGEETCELVSLSDSHSVALGYLLLAEVQANIFELTRGDLKQFYIRVYRENKYTAGLLSTALRLLPLELFAFAHDKSDKAPAPQHYSDLFLRVEPFSMRSACSARGVAALACRGVRAGVCGAGCGAARGWWSAATPRVAGALERLVTAYVAPAAVRDQLTTLHHRAHEIEDAEIRIVWSSSEVVCYYTVEESTLQLRAWLSRSHPLTPPRLSAPELSGASTTHWLGLYLAYQNGTLLNALKMWTRLVNARVEKAPQCYICYCRLHPASGRLPRVTCHQCKNKFHNMCLRKWFQTSKKSNCPLCRTIF